jgi:hypothetical protein
MIGSRATFPCAGGHLGVTAALLPLTSMAALGPKHLYLVSSQG